MPTHRKINVSARNTSAPTNASKPSKRNAKAANKPEPVNAKPTAANKPSPAPVPAATVAKRHDIGATLYAGPSPVMRPTDRKLSPINLAVGAKSPTERDDAFVAALAAKYAGRTFARLNSDAGCVRRAIAFGYMRHVGGDLASRDCQLALTADGVSRGAAINKRP